MKRLLSVLVLTCLGILAASGISSAAQELTVSAAISLKNAFEEIGKRFETQNRDMKVVFNFGASGDLVAQIRGGAPVDVFASAALKDMDALEGEGFVISETWANFAGNTVVLVKPLSSALPLFSFEDLKGPGVRKIAVGNPKTVPAGRYADEVFQYLKLTETIKDKLVFAENVRQVLDYVARGEVDAGVVYKTDAMTKTAEVLVIAAAPDGSHKPVLYPIAIVKGSRNESTARGFVAIVRAEEGRKILEKYGFAPVK